MRERIAIVDAIRTPFAKAGTDLSAVYADELAVWTVKALLSRLPIKIEEIDEVIFGNVGNPSHAANISRVIALKSGFPESTIAYTVHRNCASGMESITTAACKIWAGEGKIFLVGGTENMSQYPLMYNAKMTKLFGDLAKAKSITQKLKVISQFRPNFLTPVISVVEGLTDPVCGLNMGQTAEVLAREFHINRSEQDDFALASHLKAAVAEQKEIFKSEIIPVPIPPKFEKFMENDNCIRANQTKEALSKLSPYFDRQTGTVTAANACPLTDGAAALLIMSESEAKSRGLKVLGYMRDFAYAGLGPNRMGLGPVYSTAKLLQKTGLQIKDFQRFEINEAFAAQVLANLKAFASKDFAIQYLQMNEALGEINPDQLNVNGGAIALGHPVGASGARLVLTTLLELKRQKLERGLATLCIGGGQGAALALEAVV